MTGHHMQKMGLQYFLRYFATAPHFFDTFDVETERSFQGHLTDNYRILFTCAGSEKRGRPHVQWQRTCLFLYVLLMLIMETSWKWCLNSILGIFFSRFCGIHLTSNFCWMRALFSMAGDEVSVAFWQWTRGRKLLFCTAYVDVHMNTAKKKRIPLFLCTCSPPLDQRHFLSGPQPSHPLFENPPTMPQNRPKMMKKTFSPAFSLQSGLQPSVRPSEPAHGAPLGGGSRGQPTHPPIKASKKSKRRCLPQGWRVDPPLPLMGSRTLVHLTPV